MKILSLAATLLILFYFTENQDTSTINGKWEFISISDADSLLKNSERKPYINFHEGESRFSGYAGCNRMMGGYEVAGDSLVLSQVAATRMLCEEMRIEDTLLEKISGKSFYLDFESTKQINLIDSSGDTLVIRKTRDSLEEK